MRLRSYGFGMVLFVGSIGVCGGLGAQESVLPTGTPTWVPKKVVATPVPLTPLEQEAKTLGERLSAIDLVVWNTVRTGWSDREKCLEKVGAHLEEHQAEVTKLLAETSIINCSLEEGTGIRRVRLTSEEARKAFVSGYDEAIKALRSLRANFDSNPEAKSVLTEVRSMQRTWQREMCAELEKVKPPIEVPRPKPRPNGLPQEER